MVNIQKAVKGTDDPYTESMIQEMIEMLSTDWTYEQSTPVSGGKDTTYLTRIVDGESRQRKVILKACTTSDPDEFRDEPNLIEYINQRTTIPVPKVLEREFDGNHPDPFFVMEYIEAPSPRELKGNLWRSNSTLDMDDLRTVANQVGDHLGQLHNCGEFSALGTLAVNGDKLTVEESGRDWAEWLRKQIDHESVQLEVFEEQADRLLTFTDEMVHELPEIDPVPCHFDYRPGNFLINPSSAEIVAVLDWGDARASHDEYELALTEQYLTRWSSYTSARRKVVRRNLYDAYENHRTLERDEEFKRRRRFYLAASTAASLTWIAHLSAKKQRKWLENHWKFFDRLLNDWDRDRGRKKLNSLSNQVSGTVPGDGEGQVPHEATVDLSERDDLDLEAIDPTGRMRDRDEISIVDLATLDIETETVTNSNNEESNKNENSECDSSSDGSSDVDSAKNITDF